MYCAVIADKSVLKDILKIYTSYNRSGFYLHLSAGSFMTTVTPQNVN